MRPGVRSPYDRFAAVCASVRKVSGRRASKAAVTVGIRPWCEGLTINFVSCLLQCFYFPNIWPTAGFVFACVTSARCFIVNKFKCYTHVGLQPLY